MADIQTMLTQTARHIEMMTGRSRRVKKATLLQIFDHIVDTPSRLVSRRSASNSS